MMLLRLYDVELNRSHRDLFKSSSYSCSNVKVPTKEIFNHGVTQLKNKILKNFENKKKKKKKKKQEIPVSVPLAPRAEGCHHLKIQNQPVDQAS
jgi:hypothetical protein